MPLHVATPQEQRFAVIIRTLKNFKRPTFERIRQELRNAGLSSAVRTVRDDLRALTNLQGEWRAPIESVRDNQGHYFYRLTKESWNYETEAITEEDLRSVAFARDLLKPYRGLPPFDDLDRLVNEKLLDQADAKAQIHILNEGVGGALAFSPIVRQKIDRNVWTAVLRALQKRKALRIQYDKSRAWNQEGRAERDIEPRSLVCLGDIWYLLGSAGAKSPDLRQYKMALITRAEVLDQDAPLPKGWNVDEILENTFGRFIGNPNDLVEVEVRFTAKVRPLVLEQTFHAKEKKTVNNDGSITLKFPVTPLGVKPEWRFYHVRSWLLSWGGDVKVEKPEELKRLMAKDIQRMSELYR